MKHFHFAGFVRHCLLHLAALLASCCSIQAQNRAIDSLNLVLKTGKDDTTKVNALSNLCWEYRLAGDMPNSFLSGMKGIEMAQKADYILGLIQSYSSMGAYYKDKGQLDSALVMFDLALDLTPILTSSDDAQMREKGMLFKGKILGNHGVVYLQFGDFTKALNYYYQCLRIFTAQDKPLMVASTYSNIGDIYKAWYKNDSALAFYTKAASMQAADKDNLATTLNMMGAIYRRNEDYSKALYYQKSSLHLRDSLHLPQGIALSLSSIGILYQTLPNTACSALGVTTDSKFDSALMYHRKSIKIFESIDNKRGKANVLNFIANLYLAKKEFDSVYIYLNQANEIANEVKDLKLFEDIENTFYKSYKKQGDTARALDHFEKYFVLHDSIYSLDNRAKIAVLEITYERDKKDDELNRQIEDRDTNIGILVNVSITTGIFLFVLAILHFKQRRFADELLRANMELDDETNNLMKSVTKARLENHTLGEIHESNMENHESIRKEMQEFSDSLKTNIRLIGRLIKLQDFKEVNRIRTQLKKDFEIIHEKLSTKYSYVNINTNEISRTENNIDALLTHIEALMQREPSINARLRRRVFTFTTCYVILLLFLAGFTFRYGWEVMSPYVSGSTTIAGCLQILISIPFKKKEIK